MWHVVKRNDLASAPKIMRRRSAVPKKGCIGGASLAGVHDTVAEGYGEQDGSIDRMDLRCMIVR